ncbi:hypothetical protein LUZ60_009253 [Juncus effusus]|nr:hypothetical protein LUZ60_009253 [Juncus effusus]
MAGGGVGEMLVSAVVKEVLGKLSSQMWEQIGLIWGFNNDMKEMTKNLEMVDAVLDDAERKSFMDKPICQWLKELKSAAYAIEDMMCDFETNISPNNQGGSWGAKLQKILSTAKIVKKRVILANKMKDLRQRLDKVAMRRSQFVLNSGTRFDKEQVAKERETYADINEQTSIMGRDKEKEELIQLLMRSDGGHEVSIIAIVGLGGIGKTTLAQLLFNNESIKDTFGRQAWAYVSMEFDVKNIGRALLESFGGSSQIPSTLEGMRKSLKEKMSGKRFFIVLDDLWEEDGGKLEELRGMLRGDTKGSKIVVTTRSEKVAVQIHATELYKLEALTDDHCWDLFSQRAFTSESEKNDKDLVQIGRELVKKCAGVPLAVKSLGYTMRLKKGVDAWAEVRDSDIWKLEEKSGGSFKTSMLPSLKISYILMPSYLKLCFSYCSIFPRGCRISKNELIQQWISLGFIQPPQEGISLEKCGKEYVDDLLGMSFLHFSRSILEDKGKVCMHDLVYDHARSISGDELLVLNAEKAANNHLGGNDYRYVLILNFEDLTET